TTNTVDEPCKRLSIRFLAVSAKVESPVPSASSISNISGLKEVAIANVSLACIPEEYVFMGRAKASEVRLERSITESTYSSSSAVLIPIARSPNLIFSTPVSIGCSAAETPRSDGLELTNTSPSVGDSAPATILRRVDFPDPFRPKSPIALPLSATNDTFFTASTSCVRPWYKPFKYRPPLIGTRYVLLTFLTTI